MSYSKVVLALSLTTFLSAICVQANTWCNIECGNMTEKRNCVHDSEKNCYALFTTTCYTENAVCDATRCMYNIAPMYKCKGDEFRCENNLPVCDNKYKLGECNLVNYAEKRQFCVIHSIVNCFDFITTDLYLENDRACLNDCMYKIIDYNDCLKYPGHRCGDNYEFKCENISEEAVTSAPGKENPKATTSAAENGGPKATTSALENENSNATTSAPENEVPEPCMKRKK